MKTMSLIVFLVLISTSNVLAQPQPPCCNLGDANGDGFVTADDLVTIEEQIVGLACLSWEEQCQSDVDGDGIVTEDDVLIILDYINGHRETFPRCGDLDGDGTLEWDSGGDDVNAFTGCYVDQRGCPNEDADNDGDYDQDDFALFRRLASGQIQNFPGCACGEGACG